jgi:hypothetical protein
VLFFSWVRFGSTTTTCLAEPKDSVHHIHPLSSNASSLNYYIQLNPLPTSADRIPASRVEIIVNMLHVLNHDIFHVGEQDDRLSVLTCVYYICMLDMYIDYLCNLKRSCWLALPTKDMLHFMQTATVPALHCVSQQLCVSNNQVLVISISFIFRAVQIMQYLLNKSRGPMR